MTITKGNQPIGMVATKVTMVKSSVMEVSNNGCDWSILDSNGGSQYPGTVKRSYTIE